MSIEEDMLNAFKYVGTGGSAGHLKMMQQLFKEMERAMLLKLDAEIHARLNILTPSMQGEQLDPFKILGVTPKSTREEVEKAYRALAKSAHPDAGGSNEEMAKINAAYEVIKLWKGWK